MENEALELIEDAEILVEKLQQGIDLWHKGTPEQAKAAVEQISHQIKLHAQSLGITGEILDAHKQRLLKSGWRSILIPTDFAGSWYVPPTH